MDDEPLDGLLDEVRGMLGRLEGPLPIRWDLDVVTYEHLRTLASPATRRLWGSGAAAFPFTTMVVVDYELPFGCTGVEFSDGHYESYTY